MTIGERIDRTRRAWLRRLLGAGVLGAAWDGGRRVWAMSAVTPPASAIQKRKGIVRINGIQADVGTPVALGDIVSSGPDSEAVFVLGDDGFLLRADSQVTLADQFPVQDPGVAVRVLTLVSGGILSVFGPKRIQLETPLATIGIRGTAAYLESNPGSTYICVCYVHAVMTAKGAPTMSEEVVTHHHEAPRLIFPGTSGPVIEKMPVKNHTDEELIMLEALFGRVPPFVGNDYKRY
jgi:hypothetical protein